MHGMPCTDPISDTLHAMHSGIAKHDVHGCVYRSAKIYLAAACDHGHCFFRQTRVSRTKVSLATNMFSGTAANNKCISPPFRAC